MTDPLRFDRPAAGDADSRERDARIEELLLVGLDHYFAGRHELAINIWTRVLFLDRSHGKARAYIERARSALAVTGDIDSITLQDFALRMLESQT